MIYTKLSLIKYLCDYLNNKKVMLRQRFSFGNLERKRKINNFVDQSSEKKSQTRTHSSRMRTALLLLVSPSMHCSRGVYLVPGDVPARGGVPAQGGVPGLRGVPSTGGCTCLGVYLVPGVYLPGDVPGPGGVPGPGKGEFLPRYSPLVNRILNTRF